MLTALDKKLLEEIADLHGEPRGAFNIRKDGEGIQRRSLEGIEIIPKKDQPGIDVIVAEGKKGQVHIPVILTLTDLTDVVYNTIDIGAGADITMVAGCGIHNPGSGQARHDGVHEIIVRKGARLLYTEKHFGEGEEGGKRILNPKTVLRIEEGAYAELELIQIRGVDDTHRETEAEVAAGGRLVMFERLLTDGEQTANSDIQVKLMGAESTARIVSRSVAQGSSKQTFYPRLMATGPGRGHVECDSIIMDQAVVRSVPEIWAKNSDAELVHEAAIGKIAGEQMIKLMALGLTEEEAEEAIISGFLK
ncbi:MAG: SufD family Fe-S cluster assembly protein [Bacillota bacterium]